MFPGCPKDGGKFFASWQATVGCASANRSGNELARREARMTTATIFLRPRPRWVRERPTTARITDAIVTRRRTTATPYSAPVWER